jgi:23S rRNA A2030 N6-methylase RlmJ
MAYNHSKNIGNEGDVVKHALLARVVDHLASTGSDSEGPFIYVECHAGRPEYVLAENGSWKKGVVEFSKNRERAQIPALQVYSEVCIGDGLSVGSIYPGSAGLVFRILLKRNRTFLFILHETEPLAHAELVRYFYPWSQVSIYSTDGLAGISDLPKASLVLIDPPNLNQPQEIVNALNNLKGRRIEYVCWTPRSAGRFKDGWREADTSASFYSKTSSHKRIRVRWGEWNLQGTRGCQITVSEGLSKLAEETILEICRIMSWSQGIENE